MNASNSPRGGSSASNRQPKEHEIVTEAMKATAAKLRFGEDRPAGELFDTWAADVAEELNRARDKFNKSSQIRRFFDER